MPTCTRDSCNNGKLTKCTSKCAVGYQTSYQQDLYFGSKSYSLPANVEKIQMEIMTNGPVEAGFNVYQDFMSYSSGVYQYTKGASLGIK